MRSPRTSLLSMFGVLLILSTACDTQRIASVEEFPAASVTLTPRELSLGIGTRIAVLTIPLGTSGSTLTGQTVTWYSSNPAIAAVSAIGEASAEVVGVALGTAAITATSESGSSSIAVTVTPPATNPGTVTNLSVASATANSVTLSFTEVSNGAGLPASYDVRYVVPPLAWGPATPVAQGTCAVPVAGTAIGATRTCTVEGLAPSTNYQFQLVAFRGTLNVDAVFGGLSNVVSGTTAAPPVPVATTGVTPATASVFVGQTVQLAATPRDTSGNALTGRVVTWTSSNSAVATVSSTGLVTGVAAGAATITATSEGVPGTAAITATATVTNPGTVTNLSVASVTASSVTLAFTEVTNGAGLPASYDIRYAVAPLSWGAAMPVAQGTCSTPVAGTTIGVMRTCTVQGLAASTNYQFQLVAFRGTLNLNAVFGGLSNVASGTTTAPPAPVAAVSLAPATASVMVGQTLQLAATTRDASGSTLIGRVVTWASSNSAVASVNASGLVTGVTAGSATITATSEGKSATSTITVTATVTNPGTVTNLSVASVTPNSVTLSFTEVPNGAGAPASYDVRYAVAPLSWGAATPVPQGTCATPLAGTAIGATRTCTVLGLAASTNYQFQLVAFRGTLNLGAVFGALSNVASGTTAASTVTASTCPYRGSCNVEPGLSGRGDLLLFEDWEASNWQTHWTGIGFATNLSAVSTPVFSGSKSLQVSVPNGQHDGATFDFDFTSAGLSEPEEVYFRYYLRFNDTWQRSGDGEIGKLPGFGGTYDMAGWGCRPVNGSNGWSARMINFDMGSTNQIGFYTYHADMAGPCGDHLRWPDLLQRNQWYCIEARVRLNTISGGRGNNDGILEGWIDGRLVFTRSNLRFRDVSSLKIEKVWGNIYVGGNWTANGDMALHFDNAVIARNRIGCAN